MKKREKRMVCVLEEERRARHNTTPAQAGAQLGEPQ
jgi:hypothetical protein